MLNRSAYTGNEDKLATQIDYYSPKAIFEAEGVDYKELIIPFLKHLRLLPFPFLNPCVSLQYFTTVLITLFHYSKWQQ